MNRQDWSLFLIAWYPHSGCRWLNRSMLARHPNIQMEEYFFPLLALSDNDILELDKTSQVHKARSLKDRKFELDLVYHATREARLRGIEVYFDGMLELFAKKQTSASQIAGGVLPPGRSVRTPQLDLLYQALPKLKIIHLVRDPIECYASTKSRHELPGDAHAAAGAWLRYNSYLREFHSLNSKQESYLAINYDHLVKDPSRELQKICQFVDLDYDSSMLDGEGEYHGRNQGADIVSSLVTDQEKEILSRHAGHEYEHYL